MPGILTFQTLKVDSISLKPFKITMLLQRNFSNFDDFIINSYFLKFDGDYRDKQNYHNYKIDR